MTCLVEKSGFRSTAIWRLWAVVLLATFVGVAGFGVALAQDAADQEAATAATPTDAPAVAPVDDAAEENVVATAPAKQADNDVAADTQPEAEGGNLEGFAMLTLVIALFVVPLFLGNRFAKSLKMPDHGWKFALAIGTLAAAATVVAPALYFKEVKFGPDLSGGLTLIYELQETSLQEDTDQDDAQGAGPDQKTIVDQLIIALAERVDPSGTKEVTIRKYGAGQIEIIIPKASEQEEEYIKRRISTAGALEFRITASRNFVKHRSIIEQAEQLPTGENELWQGESKVAEWVPYSVKAFGPVDLDESRIIKRQAGILAQALVLTNDGLDVTGE
ncbi:MAG: hypothetical protein IH898_05510, partial [Planctomycetes bacterium]|nr:hypothetical protein [Planctomycetota bacterium]